MVMSPDDQDCDVPTLSTISYEFAIFVLPHPPDAPLPHAVWNSKFVPRLERKSWNRLRDEDTWQCARQPIILIEPRPVAGSERVHFSVPNQGRTPPGPLIPISCD